MSGKGNNNRDNGMFKWFGKNAPGCFNPAKEQDGRSGDGSDTARTPRRMIQRSEEEDSRGKSIADSINEEGDVAEEHLKRNQEDRKGKGPATSSNEEGDVDVVDGSNRGVEKMVVGSSSRGGRDNGGMLNWFGCVSCLNPANEQVDDTMNNIQVRGYHYSGGGEKALSFWSRDLDSHYSGSFSIAVIQANKILEDYSQVEVGKKATFVGIYDGHGGTLAAEHVCNDLTKHLMGLVRETRKMSRDNLKQAFLRTEQAWVNRVSAEFKTRPVVFAGCGACCLVGVVWKGNLYVANVGDSRAIIGRVVEEVEGSPEFTFEQLTRDDNVKDLDVRAEVQKLYPDDPDIVIQKGKSWYIKGRLQLSKAIGDVYLKIPRFSLDKYKGYKLNKPVRLKNPAVTARPTPTMTPLGPQDRFVIFASDGLWDQLSNQEAADIVHQNPQEGIAARLIREALDKAAEKTKKSYDSILKLKVMSGLRRQYFDDMTVVVLFLNEDIQKNIPLISVKGGKHQITVDVSNFTALDELAEGGVVVASSSEGGGGAGPSSSGGGGEAVPSLSGGEGDVASGGEGDVAS